MVISESEYRKIIPVASGKGGVGKSFITANLGMLLAAYGKRTVLVDMDLGGSNLHTYLGMKNRNLGIGNFLSDKKIRFSDLVGETPYENLAFVPGDVLVPGTANLMHSQRKSIISNILKLEADYVLIDLGSGTAPNVIDFFLISNSGLIVTTPQTPAILNAYNFLKNLTFRHLQQSVTSPKKVVDYLKDVVKDKTPGATPTISSILSRIAALSAPAGRTSRSEISSLRPHVIVNMAETPDDLDIAENLHELISKNLEIEIGCMGMVYHDRAVGRALKNHAPLAAESPDSLAAREIERMAQKILQSPKFTSMPLDLEEYADSFELTRIEAQNDFPESDGADRPDAAVNDEEFLAIITAQKRQIEELKGTVRMLTMNQR